ncbi:acyl-CoA thioesterase domain-containing protein [Brevundimonas sp.]|uniref:acyl-CoA thioesterase domain-containing protein n=1 Tax=Brevundimonas sp. TaxID=1871086 RepID=UPI003D125F96
MPEQTIQQALTLTPGDDGVLSADLHGDFSNGRLNAPPETGFPFGGLIAALCAASMQTGLSIAAPLRSLSVQYMTPARFGQPIRFTPRLLRGGRSASSARSTSPRRTGRLRTA